MTTSEFSTLFDAYKSAAENKDIVGMMSLYHEDICAFDTWETWAYRGIAAWRVMNEGWFASLGDDRDVIEYSDIVIDIRGEIGFSSAIVRFSAVSPDGTTLRSMQNRLTWVARKIDDQWLIVHQHASVPIDPTTAGAIFSQ